MFNNPELFPRYKEAYRAASGIEHEQACQNLQEKYQFAKGLDKVGAFARRSFAPSDRQDWGYRELNNLIANNPGTYLWTAITFDYDVSYGGGDFQYSLVALGKDLGESGEVKLHRYQKRIFLRKGVDPLVEIAADRKYVLHLPESEGITITASAHCSSPAGVASGAGMIVLAIWYPEISETPQSFFYPAGGRTDWKAKRTH